MPTYHNLNIYDVNFPYPKTKSTHKTVIKAGETVATTIYLTDAELAALNVEKTLETPYAKLSNSLDSLDFTGVETKSVTDLLDSSIIRVKTDTNILIKANSNSNPNGYHLGSYEGFVDIRNDREIYSLYITSEADGTVWVMGLLE